MEVVLITRDDDANKRRFWKEIVEACHHHNCRHCNTTCFIILVFLLMGTINCSIYQVVEYQFTNRSMRLVFKNLASIINFRSVYIMSNEVYHHFVLLTHRNNQL